MFALLDKPFHFLSFRCMDMKNLNIIDKVNYNNYLCTIRVYH